MGWCQSTPVSAEYVLPVSQSTSDTPDSPYTHGRWLMMYLEVIKGRVERCTWRMRSSELRDAFGGQNPVNSETHFMAVIERIWRCTLWPRSSELRYAHWGRDQARLEMQLGTEIEWTQRGTARLWLSEFGDAPAGYGQAMLEEYFKVVDMESGATAAETVIIC